MYRTVYRARCGPKQGRQRPRLRLGLFDGARTSAVLLRALLTLSARAIACCHEAVAHEGQAARHPVLDEPAKRRGVEVLADHVGEEVITAFPDAREAHFRRRGEVAVGLGGQVAQERAPETVVVEDPVPGGAAH